MNKIIRFSAILLTVIMLFTFTSCGARKVNTVKEGLDSLGFTKLFTKDEFYALSQNFTYNGTTADELMEFESGDGSQKEDAQGTLVMRHSTKAENGSKYETVYQQFVTKIALEGLAINGVTVGTPLKDALEAIAGNDKALTKFKHTESLAYEMLLAEKDEAKLVFYDMTKDASLSGYRYAYQIRYTDRVRNGSDGESTLTKRTLILAFDHTLEGSPLVSIEIVLETRVKI